MKKRYWLAVAAIFAAPVPSVTTPANAAGVPLTLCNKTSAEIYVAVGYYTSGVKDTANPDVLTGPFVSHGWGHLVPGDCHYWDNPSSARYMFWFAYGPGLNESKMRAAFMRDPQWKYHFCAWNYFIPNGPPFTYEDENASIAACDQAGGWSSESPDASHTLWVTVNKVDLIVNPHVDFSGCVTSECAPQWDWDPK